ncbi:MAG: PAS domain-containing protein [Spirochaetaceae bacterium]
MYPERYEFDIDAEDRGEILEAVGVPFIVVGSSLRVLFFSQQAGTLFGLKLSDIGRPLGSVLPPGEADQALHAVETALDRMRPVRAQLEIAGASDYEQRVQVLETPDGAVSGAVLTYAPHAGSDRSVRRLEQLVEFYESVLSRLPDLVARFDRGHRFIYANPAMAAAAELDIEDMLGRTAEELGLSSSLQRLCATEVEATVVTGEPFSETVSISAEEGDERKLWWRMIPELNTLGSVGSVFVVATDVTPLAGGG